jgi:hypothetical protein
MGNFIIIKRWIYPIAFLVLVLLILFHEHISTMRHVPTYMPAVTSQIQNMNDQELIDIALGRTKFPMRFDRDRALQALQQRTISHEGIRELTTNFASLQPDGLITTVQAQGEDITLYVSPQDQFYIVYTFVTRILDSETILDDVLAEALPLLRIDGVGAIYGDVRFYVFGLIPIHKGFYSGGTPSVQDTLLRVLRERYGVDYGYDVEAWRSHIPVEEENQLQDEAFTSPSQT